MLNTNSIFGKKCVEDNGQEYEQLIKSILSSSSMSDTDKYEKFHVCWKKMKSDESKRKRYRQTKLKREQQTHNEEHK